MLSVIKDLSYTTNLAAHSVRSRAKNLVGFIMPDIAYPFAVEMMQGVNRAIAESRLYPLVYTTDDVRKRGSAHTNPRIGRRDKSRAVAADHGVGAGCRTSDYCYHRRRSIWRCWPELDRAPGTMSQHASKSRTPSRMLIRWQQSGSAPYCLDAARTLLTIAFQ